jgi:hypothetical protein
VIVIERNMRECDPFPKLYIFRSRTIWNGDMESWTLLEENTKIPSVKPTHVNKMKGEKKIKLNP